MCSYSLKQVGLHCPRETMGRTPNVFEATMLNLCSGGLQGCIIAIRYTIHNQYFRKAVVPPHAKTCNWYMWWNSSWKKCIHNLTYKMKEMRSFWCQLNGTFCRSLLQRWSFGPKATSCYNNNKHQWYRVIILIVMMCSA